MISARGVYLFVSDLDASLRFYERLGLRIEKVSDVLGRGFAGKALVLEFGTAELTASYDASYVAAPDVSKGTINFELDSAVAVNDIYEQLTRSGYRGHLAPIDAQWQARFAVVLDPDGNQIGLHGPRSLEQDREREVT